MYGDHKACINFVLGAKPKCENFHFFIKNKPSHANQKHVKKVDSTGLNKLEITNKKELLKKSKPN